MGTPIAIFSLLLVIHPYSLDYRNLAFPYQVVAATSTSVTCTANRTVVDSPPFKR
jgi:hypothetical protein